MSYLPSYRLYRDVPVPRHFDYTNEKWIDAKTEKQYCKSNDRWLGLQFKHFDGQEKQDVMNEYSHIYRTAGEAEPLSHRKTTTASMKANIWLLEKIKEEFGDGRTFRD